MTDYGRPLRFGYFLEPLAAQPEQLISAAKLLDELGFDLLGVQDHPYQRRFLDTWTLLATLAAHTSRLTVFPDVANLALRPPAVLAKAAASLDLLSGGRFELGLGSGGFPDAVAAMGGPRRTPAEAVAALEEAITVIRMMWSGERGLRFDGEHCQLAGVHSGPVPAHPIGIWLGAYKPKMLALVGRLADGWLPSLDYADMTPADLAQAATRIDEAAAGAGRDPAAIRRICNIGGDRATGEWIDLLTQLALEAGMDTFIVGGPAEEAPLRRYTEEIFPAVREAVAAERA